MKADDTTEKKSTTNSLQNILRERTSINKQFESTEKLSKSKFWCVTTLPITVNLWPIADTVYGHKTLLKVQQKERWGETSYKSQFHKISWRSFADNKTRWFEGHSGSPEYNGFLIRKVEPRKRREKIHLSTAQHNVLLLKSKARRASCWHTVL